MRVDLSLSGFKGHPVFVAQHAVAACCRSCLAKWYGIEKGVALNDEQIDYIIRVICLWLQRQLAGDAPSGNPDRLLFT